MPMAGLNNPTTPGGGAGGGTNNPGGGGGGAVTPGGGAAAAAAAAAGGGGAQPGSAANNAAAAAAPAPITAKTWELSDYELQRTPQEAITDGTEIAVSPRALHSELMCPICLDMLHQTMTTKECLHRFCAECIITALRSGNKECPTCRKKLVSKRSLRPDPNFDMLIKQIYPSRDEYEAQQQKALASLSKSHNQLALATSIEEGMKAQFQMRKQIAKANAAANKSNHDGTESNAESANNNVNNATAAGVSGSQNTSTVADDPVAAAAAAAAIARVGGAGPSVPNNSGPPPPPPGSSVAAGASKVNKAESVGENSSNTSAGSEETTEVELVFKPHPDMQVASAQQSAGLPSEHIQTRFIKTSGNASVDHLRKYLGMRLALDSDGGESEEGPMRNYCTIWIAPHGNFIKIPPGLTLGQICDKYWRINKPLEVYYYWKKV